MKIINQSGRDIQVRAWDYGIRGPLNTPLAKIQLIKSNEGFKEPFSAELFGVSQHDRCDLEIGYFPVGKSVVSEIYDSRFGSRLDKEADWPFKDDMGVPLGSEIVVTPNYRSRLVDWTKAKRSIDSDINENHAAMRDDKTAQAALDVGVTIITSLSTGIAALGPVGALPAGLLIGLGSIFLMILGGPQSSGPPPLTAQQVEDIVTKVVRREQKIREAETAATLFASATRGLALRRQRIAQEMTDGNGRFTGSDLTQAEKDDFINFRRQALDEASSNSLHFHIVHMAGDPDRAKWILPAFLDGIATYLTLYALHLMDLNTRPGPPSEVIVSAAEVADFRSRVWYLGGSLQRAQRAFEAVVTERIEEIGLQGCGYTEEVTRRLIRKSIIDVEDTQKITNGLTALLKLVHVLDTKGAEALSIRANG